MANEIRVIKDDEVIGEGEKVEIKGVGANKNAAKGAYQYATIADGEETSAYVDVPAFKTKTIAVTSVKLDKSTLSGKVGDKGKLTPTIAPSNATNKGVTFDSSDAAIVKIDNSGNYEFLKNGSADITVKTNDGGKTAVCKVTVKDPVVNVTGVKLDKTTATIKVGEKLKLNATVEPSNATNKAYKFMSSNRSIASTTESGEATGVSKGTVDIIVETEDGSKQAKCTLTIEEPETEESEE